MYRPLEMFPSENMPPLRDLQKPDSIKYYLPRNYTSLNKKKMRHGDAKNMKRAILPNWSFFFLQLERIRII